MIIRNQERFDIHRFMSELSLKNGPDGNEPGIYLVCLFYFPDLAKYNGKFIDLQENVLVLLRYAEFIEITDLGVYQTQDNPIRPRIDLQQLWEPFVVAQANALRIARKKAMSISVNVFENTNRSKKTRATGLPDDIKGYIHGFLKPQDSKRGGKKNTNKRRRNKRKTKRRYK
jgi:hypothetical protein